MLGGELGGIHFMRIASVALRGAALGFAAISLSGCLAASAAGAVAGAAVGVTTAAVKGTVHVGHVAVDAVTPDGGDKAPDGGR
jgi:hypothetical protein